MTWQQKNFLFKRLGLLDYSYKNKSGLYLIENLDSNRFYFGSAVDLYKRMHVHLCQLKGNYHHNAFLQRDYNSGNKNLVFTVLELMPKDLLITEEQKYIDAVDENIFCYNICQVAGSWLGKKHSSDSKKLQSSVKQGDKNPMWGRQHNESTKLSMSITQKGISKPKFQCHKCGKIVGGKSNLERWHGDKCKQSSTH